LGIRPHSSFPCFPGDPESDFVDLRIRPDLRYRAQPHVDCVACYAVSRRAKPTAVSVSELVQMLRSRGYTENSGAGSSGGGGGTGNGIYPPLQSLRFGR